MKKKIASSHNEPLTKSENLFPVVGIGASAGGLDAFKKLIKSIPTNSGMAFILVQHLDPKHKSLLPDILQKTTSIPVIEIFDDIKISPDNIYVLPSNKMLIANNGKLELSMRITKPNELNLPIDLFFESLAEVHQSHAIGVVLSGTASDGTKGLKAIKHSGGITIAQDTASATYDSMPVSAVNAGVVDFILSPEEIPQKLLELIKITADKGFEGNIEETHEDVFRQIISLLRMRKGTDFTYYKQTTIRRRIIRRMALSKNEEPALYLKYLRENKKEQDLLYQDLLIPVTEFFRDNNSFEHLCNTVFPNILKNKTNNSPIRIWIAGCSTGEEAYSIAICLKEFLGVNDVQVKIFASDISEPAIIKARTGIYTKSDVAGISPQRMQEFFTKNNGGYQVNKELRDICVFALHNFLKDPPFGKMDIISCRNVLIYMEPYLQKKALTTFHYALNPKGFLLLGKSETISNVPDLFSTLVKTEKLFLRKDVPDKFMQVTTEYKERTLLNNNTNLKSDIISTDFQKTADDIMLNRYTPAGVVVNEQADIVYFRGKTSDYLEQPQGKPTASIFKMAKKGLSFELRNILHKASKQKKTVIKENVSIPINDSLRTITIEAMPLPNVVDPHYLILFHNHIVDNNPYLVVKKKSAKNDNKDQHILQLEQELAQLREDMRGITESQEAANEELQSANEELLSSGEEMQSLNDELETGKEELQSTNEELTIVNQEIISLNDLITAERNYSESIVANLREPLIVLDKDLKIKTANEAFYKTFKLNELETEGIFIYDLGNKQWDIPELRILLESIIPEKTKFNDFEMRYTFSNIGYRVMLLNARQILNSQNSEKLILLSIEDVTEKTNNRKKIEESESHFRLMAELMPAKVSNAKADGEITYFNNQWIEYSGLSLEDLKDFGYHKIMHPEEKEEFISKLQKAAKKGKTLEMEMRFLDKNGNFRWHLNIAAPMKDELGNIKMWVIVTTEIQQHKEQKAELEKAAKERTSQLKEANGSLKLKNEELYKMNIELEAFTYVSSHDLQEPLRKIRTFADLIIEKEYQNLSENGRNMFIRMQLASERMQMLIQSLLAFARLGTSERKFEKTDLASIIENIKIEMEETIAEKNAIIEVSAGCIVTIIPFQIHQLMFNLISNALKFARPDVPPHIKITCSSMISDKHNKINLQPNKKYCQITVEDNGIGFEKEYSEKIFEVFQKLHIKEEYAGTGIGLAIVKKIVDNHNGIITASSELNKGARFDIYLLVKP